MKFRRDWPIIWRDIYGGSLLLFFAYSVTLGALLYNDNDYQQIVFDALLILCFILICSLGYYSIGVFTTYIVLNEDGIVLLERKKAPMTLRWGNIIKISRTRYKVGKTLVFEDVFGHKIWFRPTKKIEKYIRENHPELDPIFPDKKSYKKWTEVL